MVSKVERGETGHIQESDNPPRELPGQIVWLLGAMKPEIMTVWQSQVLGSYGTVVLDNNERVLVIAHLEKDDASDNPFDKKITWWRDTGISADWNPPI